MSAAVVEADGLGRRFRNRWALADCTLTVPAGKVVGLVGPNGAGKSTLLNLTVGLLAPSAGRIAVLGAAPASSASHLARVGFVAQDTPLYGSLTVADHLCLGARANPTWDHAFARERLEDLGVDLAQRARHLSGGQRAQLALTLAVSKRPELLVLDEPVASLDPLARREFLQSLMEVVTEREVTVLLSSHLMEDVERVCDHVIVLVESRVRAAGDVDDLIASHHLLIGPVDGVAMPRSSRIVCESHTERQRTVLVHSEEPPLLDDRWSVRGVSLEDIVLGYMRQPTAAGRGSRHLTKVAS